MNDNLLIRDARPEDMPEILAIQQAAIAAIDPHAYTQEERRAWSRTPAVGMDGLVRGGRYFVAEAAGKVAGGAGWEPMPDPADAAAMRAVFVHPAWGGRYIGARLVRRVEVAITAAGRRRILVPASLNAVPFYERLGYVSNEIGIIDLDGVDLRYRQMWKTAA